MLLSRRGTRYRISNECGEVAMSTGKTVAVENTAQAFLEMLEA